MLKFNQRNLGLLLIAFSIILIIVLGFVKFDMDKKDAFLCQAIHSNPDMDMSQCPVHQSNSSWFIVVLFGITFLILGIGAYLSFVPIKKEEQQFKKVDFSKLHKEEKDIYRLLKENEGSMYQSDILKETEFSKVKLTRILDKMESKKVLERKRRGMTNIVVLK